MKILFTYNCVEWNESQVIKCSIINLRLTVPKVTRLHVKKVTKAVQLAKLGRVIGSSLVESFTKGYTLTDPNGTEEKYT